MEWYRDRFAGKTVLVTGASSGIGLATADRLLAEGATVVGADIDKAPSLQRDTGRFIFVHTDVRDEEAAVDAVTTAVEVGGRLDGLVHAAGVAGSGVIHEFDVAEWERIIAINLTGTFVMLKAVLAQMVGQEPEAGERGAIVTMASIGGMEALGGGSSHNAAYGGVVLLTRSLALDYGPVGIRANVVCPGVIATPMTEQAFASPQLADIEESYRVSHALRRFGQADEVAASATFLLSADASFMTGAAVPVDGGYLAGRAHGAARYLFNVD